MKRSLLMERGVAFHEAGHAAACFCLRTKFAYVTITPDENTAGHLKNSRQRRICGEALRRAPFERLPAWIDRRLMICLAGEVAQKKGARKSFRPHHASGDRLEFDEWFSATNAAGEEEYYDYCVTRLECMFENPLVWLGVVAIADALIGRRKLAYADSKEIFLAVRGPGFVQLARELRQAFGGQ